MPLDGSSYFLRLLALASSLGSVLSSSIVDVAALAGSDGYSFDAMGRLTGASMLHHALLISSEDTRPCIGASITTTC